MDKYEEAIKKQNIPGEAMERCLTKIFCIDVCLNRGDIAEHRKDELRLKRARYQYMLNALREAQEREKGCDGCKWNNGQMWTPCESCKRYHEDRYELKEDI